MKLTAEEIDGLIRKRLAGRIPDGKETKSGTFMVSKNKVGWSGVGYGIWHNIESEAEARTIAKQESGKYGPNFTITVEKVSRGGDLKEITSFPGTKK